MSSGPHVFVELPGDMSDDTARRYLEELLNLRRRAKAGDPAGLGHATGAAFRLAELTRHLSKWVCQALELTSSREGFHGMSMSQIRYQIVRFVELGLPVLQQEARQDLVDALDGLNAGYVAPLLQKSVNRRRREPAVTAEAEFLILKWVRYQRGQGNTLTKSRQEAANVVHCDVETIKKWQPRIEEIYGKEHVRAELELAERLGRHDLGCKTILDLRPFDSDEDLRLWEAKFRIRLDIRDLAEMRRKALQEDDDQTSPSPTGN